MRHHMARTIQVLAGTGAVAALTAGLTSGASADSTSFANQARTAGLTAEQTQGLQTRIDQGMREHPGGQQTGINQITWNDEGVRLTLPLPGETQARTVDEPRTTKGTPNCPKGNACLYEDVDYQGRRLEEYRCGKFRDLTSEEFGARASSLHNNQVGRTVTTLYQWRNGEWDRIRSEPTGATISDLDDENDKAGGWVAC